MESRKVPYNKIFTPKNMMAMILITIGLHILIHFGLNLIYPLIPHTMVEGYEAKMESSGYGQDLWPTVFALLIGPIREEIIFRGAVFYYSFQIVRRKMKPQTALMVANVFQAFVFGVLHGNLIQGVFAFIMGFVFGYLAYRFGSILPSILCHMLFNALSAFAMEPLSTMLPQNSIIYGIVMIVGGVAGVLGFGIMKDSKERTSES